MPRLGTSLCVAVCLACPAWSKPQDFGSLLGGLLNGGGGAARALGGGGGLGDIASNIRNAIRSNPVIQQRILTNDLNPCDGAPPASCQCTDGETIAFSIEYNSNPCRRTRGATPDRCTCPSGETFLVKDVAQRAADRFNIPTCGGDQVQITTNCEPASLPIPWHLVVFSARVRVSAGTVVSPA